MAGGVLGALPHDAGAFPVRARTRGRRKDRAQPPLPHFAQQFRVAFHRRGAPYSAFGSGVRSGVASGAGTAPRPDLRPAAGSHADPFPCASARLRPVRPPGSAGCAVRACAVASIQVICGHP